jgi:hypothetical protein
LKTNRSADRGRTFNNPAALNLQTVSGCPDFGPQKCIIVPTAAAAAITLTTEDNASLVFTGLAAGVPVPVPVPVKAVVSSTTCIMFAHWWCFPTKDDNQVGPFPLNA